jgi:hypothetical protein
MTGKRGGVERPGLGCCYTTSVGESTAIDVPKGVNVD